VLGISDETFDGSFPFAPCYEEINGFAMHFVDEGSGEPIVLVHGDPTWGYLYRRFIAPLAQHWRCVVPDHMGMGKYDTPLKPYPYQLHHHIDNLEALLLRLNLHDVTLVLHDWGGPVGLGVAIRQPQRIKRLALMNTWAFAPWPGAPFPRLVELIRSARGEKFVLEKNGYVEPALLGTTAHPEHLTETVMAAYRAPFPTPESRRALLCWSRDIPVSPEDPSYAEMQRIERSLPQLAAIPILLVWGMQDPVLTKSVLRMWQHMYPHAITHELEDASHFLQEDAPDRIIGWIEQFLAAHP
jgi:haloalkane dehalogenase